MLVEVNFACEFFKSDEVLIQDCLEQLSQTTVE